GGAATEDSRLLILRRSYYRKLSSREDQMRPSYRVAFLCVPLLAAPIVRTRDPAPTAVLEAMREELQRSVQQLKTQPDPPYFVSYEITETATANVSAGFGALRQSSERRRRQLDVDVRVGDYSLDNTRQIRGSFP